MTPRTTWALATVFGIVVLGVSIGVWPRAVAISPTTPETVGPDSVWPGDYIVAPGDRVVGSGQLVASGDDPTRLCTGTDIVIREVFRCSSLSVVVRGVDVGSLVGALRSDGAVYVNDAVVHGTWDGHVLTVDQVGGAAVRFPVAPILACQYIVPGGVKDDQGGAGEGPYQLLRSIVDGDESGYAGSWVALDGLGTIVVATTKELVTTGSALRRDFQFPLCLVQVRYGKADLSSIIDRLRLAAGISWRPELDIKRNRVLVRIPVLDDAVVQAFLGEPAVELVPLVIKEQ